jgi:hypothetical protein
MMVKGLIERSSAGDLNITKDGRAVLDALLNRKG